MSRVLPQDAEVIPLKEAQLDADTLHYGLLRRDTRAVAVLFDRYGLMVNRLVWRLLGADPEHDDVVQNVFFNVLSSVSKLKNPNAMGEWISGVTVNTVRREIRSRQYRRRFFRPMEAAEDLLDNVNQDEKILGRRFHWILRKMHADLQVLFVLRYVEKMTVEEISSTMNCSRSTVKRRLFEARKMFMKHAADDLFWASFLEEYNND